MNLLSIKSLIFLLCFVTTGFSYGQSKKKADKDTKIWRYEIEAVQTGVQGTYLIKVWSYSKKPDVAIEQAKKNAVHGILFKGFAAKQGIPGQKALCSDQSVEEQHKSFFNDFFSNGGRYMQFVNLSTDGAVAAEDRMKIGKEYKVGVLVSVNVTALRKYLEDEKIIKSLSSGF